jgi:hypothetical protein
MTTNVKQQCLFPNCITLLHDGHTGGYCYAHEDSVVDADFIQKNCEACTVVILDSLQKKYCDACKKSCGNARKIIKHLQKKNFYLSIQTPKKMKGKVTIAKIIQLVASAYSVSIEEVYRSSCYTKKVLWARQVSIYLVHTDLMKGARGGLAHIARHLESDDRTIGRSYYSIENTVEKDPKTREIIERIRASYLHLLKEAMPIP